MFKYYQVLPILGDVIDVALIVAFILLMRYVSKK